MFKFGPGRNVYVINPTGYKAPIYEDNVIRFKGFDLKVDKVNQITSNPWLAITPTGQFCLILDSNKIHFKRIPMIDRIVLDPFLKIEKINSLQKH